MLDSLCFGGLKADFDRLNNDNVNKNQTHSDLNMSTNTNTQQGDIIDHGSTSTSISAALSEAHNVIYSTEDTVLETYLTISL